MAWYGQKNYNDIMGGQYTIAEIGCFLTAFSNLLQKFGTNIDPPALNKVFKQRNIYLEIGDGVPDGLAWSSVTAYDGSVHVSRQGGAGWPDTNNAIVKFAFTSRQTGQPTTHFCLVADPKAHTIIDSWDGVIRSPGYYGEPVGWAEYEGSVAEPVTPQVAPTSTPSSSDSVYVMQSGDTIWGIAIKLGFTAQELMDHNGISQDQVRSLPIGYQVHLPVKQAPPVATIGITYEALPEAKVMHVTKAGGAEKWAFGNIKHWSDFKSAEHVAENTDVTIVGIAHVLFDNQVVAYYMDALAFGNCAQTGVPTNTIGFNWSDVTEGNYIPPQPAIEPAPAPAEPAPAVVADITPAEPPTVESPNAYKTTYKALPEPAVYLFKNTIMVHEFDGRKPDKQMVKNQGVVIGGTFIADGKTYARPKSAADVGLWFGIPVDQLDSEQDVYNKQLSLQDKRIMGNSLSWIEKLTVLREMIAGALIKARSIVKNIKK